MKNLFLLSFLLISIFLQSQKNDFKWLLGYSTLDIGTDTNWGTTIIDFDTPDGNPLMHYDGKKRIDFLVSSGIMSTDDGKYLFSCNGIYVEDSSGNLMKNADRLSNSEDKYNSPRGIGESIPQGVLVLPIPNSPNKYAMFNKTATVFENYGIACEALFYSIIEYSQSNPNGIMTYRKKTLIRDTLDLACLTATKHANGQDWWVIISEANRMGYCM